MLHVIIEVKEQVGFGSIAAIILNAISMAFVVTNDAASVSFIQSSSGARPEALINTA
jgi:hypothetical protein